MIMTLKTTWRAPTVIFLTHPIVSSTNQENGKYSPSLTMVMTPPLHLLGISNMPTTIMWHLFRPRCPPRFISCLKGTLFHVLSHNNSQKILDTSHRDLANILLLQGQFCSRSLLQMSKLFTHDAQEQALLQGPKAFEFVKTLHQLYCLLCGVLIQSNHIVSPEIFPVNCYIYKQQEDYLCFDGDFDNDNGDDDRDVSKASLLPSIIPTTTPTTAASDLLLILINQVPVTPPPP